MLYFYQRLKYLTSYLRPQDIYFTIVRCFLDMPKILNTRSEANGPFMRALEFLLFDTYTHI